MSEPWPSIIGGLTEALIGGVIGFLVAYFAFRLRKERKLLEYRVLSIPLLRFRPAESSALQVAASERVLTEDETAPEDSFVTVESAYGFRLKFRNAGNLPIENWTAEVKLNENAKIVDCETSPAPHSAFPINAQRDEEVPSRLHLSVPYINPDDEISLSITSVDNTDDGCQIKVFGIGVDVQEAVLQEVKTMEFFSKLLLRMAPVILVIVAFAAHKELAKLILPGSVRVTTEIIEKEKVSVPLWYRGMMGALLLLVLGWYTRTLDDFLDTLMLKRTSRPG